MRLSCPFANHDHEGFEDEVWEAVMACRAKAAPERRGDVDAVDLTMVNVVGCYKIETPWPPTGAQESALAEGVA